MAMGIGIAPAEDSWGEDDIKNAQVLYPNGASEIQTFSSSYHWFRFSAEQGVTYQIFTRPVKEGRSYSAPDTVLYLYHDPTQTYTLNAALYPCATTSKWTTSAAGGFSQCGRVIKVPTASDAMLGIAQTTVLA